MSALHNPLEDNVPLNNKTKQSKINWVKLRGFHVDFTSKNMIKIFKFSVIKHILLSFLYSRYFFL